MAENVAERKTYLNNLADEASVAKGDAEKLAILAGHLRELATLDDTDLTSIERDNYGAIKQQYEVMSRYTTNRVGRGLIDTELLSLKIRGFALKIAIGEATPATVFTRVGGFEPDLKKEKK